MDGGSSGGSGHDDSSEEEDDDSIGENGGGSSGENGGGSSGEGNGGEDDSSGENEDGSSGDDEQEVEAVLASGADEVLDLAFGRLDRGSLDARSQCLLDTEDVLRQDGLQVANRALMLADGHDLWTVCLTAPDPPDGSTLTVTDANGVAWGSGTLVSLEDVEEERDLGQDEDGRSAHGLTVSDGSTLWPVGHTYVRDASDDTERHVSTLYLLLPNGRPDGAWTIALTQGDDTLALSSQTPTCGAPDARPVPPWPVDPGLHIVTVFDDVQWTESPEWEPLISDFRAVDHCLATPLVVGQPWQHAVTALEAAHQGAGLSAPEVTFTLACSDDTDAVTRQSPVPNGVLRTTHSLDASIPCPPMPDVVGMTVDQAQATLVDLSQPPYTLLGEPTGTCTDGDTVIQSSFPAAGDTSYRRGGDSLRVDLRC